MANKKRKRRSDGIATRKRVLAVATSMFAAGGYEATSLRQIAAAADIDIATLKYHFDDKSNLFALVYQQGHETFVARLMPIISQFDEVSDAADVRRVVREIVTSMHDFVSEEPEFVKLTLFRLLEEDIDTIDLEDDLQKIALDMLEERFKSLIERGVVAPIDPRALVVFLISSFSMWHVSARLKKSWMNPPYLDTPEGRARSERYFITTFERLLGVEEDASAPRAGD